jgi:hypothetical protein
MRKEKSQPSPREQSNLPESAEPERSASEEPQMPLCRERIEGGRKHQTLLCFALLCFAAEFLFRFDLLRERADGQGVSE